jgi:hypothetical protein
MNEQPLVTLKEASRILRAPPHRIIHLCESDVVKPEVGAGGRGSVRRFSPDNIFVAAVALRLQDAGLTVKQLALVREALYSLTRVRVLKDEVEKGGLLGTVASLRRGERPVLLHVFLSDFLAGSRGRAMQGSAGGAVVAIECGQRLPQPPVSGVSFHTDDRRLVVAPVRVVVNLSQLCQEALSRPSTSA